MFIFLGSSDVACPALTLGRQLDRINHHWPTRPSLAVPAAQGSSYIGTAREGQARGHWQSWVEGKGACLVPLSLAHVQAVVQKKKITLPGMLIVI